MGESEKAEASDEMKGVWLGGCVLQCIADKRVKCECERHSNARTAVIAQQLFAIECPSWQSEAEDLRARRWMRVADADERDDCGRAGDIAADSWKRMAQGAGGLCV